MTGTWEGRAVVGGAAVKGAVWLIEAGAGVTPRVLTAIDTIASVAIAAGAIWFFVRAIAIARRRLLWRVRRKLVISYIFIGFIPAALIVAFFLLSGMLLFSNFSSYLLQTRLRELSARFRRPRPPRSNFDSPTADRPTASCRAVNRRSPESRHRRL